MHAADSALWRMWGYRIFYNRSSVRLCFKVVSINVKRTVMVLQRLFCFIALCISIMWSILEVSHLFVLLLRVLYPLFFLFCLCLTAFLFFFLLSSTHTYSNTLSREHKNTTTAIFCRSAIEISPSQQKKALLRSMKMFLFFRSSQAHGRHLANSCLLLTRSVGHRWTVMMRITSLCAQSCLETLDHYTEC